MTEHSDGLPSQIDITLKQFSVRDFTFDITKNGVAYDGTGDEWRWRCVASDGTVLFNVTETGMTLSYTAGPPAIMTVKVNGQDAFVHDEIICGYFELRNVSREIIHAEGRYEVRPSISEDI